MDKVTIAALAIGVLLLIAVAMFSLDAWAQFHGKTYTPPAKFVEWCQIGIQAAIGVLGYATLRGGRKAVEDAKKTKSGPDSGAGSDSKSDTGKGK